MASIRYARPRLITSADRRYRQHVEHYLLQRQNQRASRPPSQRDIFGQQAETTLRDWLAAQLELAETRILEYEEVRGRRAHLKYRELDALSLNKQQDQSFAWVFEIKASRKAQSIRRASRQLQETREILQLLFPTVYATILLVDTGIPTPDEIAALALEPDAPSTLPEPLEEVLATLPHINQVGQLDDSGSDGALTDLLIFTVDDIITLAGAENLALDWEEDDAESVPQTPTGPTLLYSTDHSEEDDTAQAEADASDNPLAAALRRAGLT